jgi:putative ABC transport system substrate-binding protein
LKADGIETVIALGNAGYRLAQGFSNVMPVVVGAVLLTPGEDQQGMSGVSLIPDPELLISKLKQFVPAVKDVSVIYHPEQSRNAIMRATSVSRALAITLDARAVADVKESAARYHALLEGIANGSTAVWLPQNDDTLDDDILLPLVLRNAWDKGFVVFSSNLDHVRRGALFSLYPDNEGLGRHLAALALQRSLGPDSKSGKIEYLRDVRIAVNLRTAEHLGLSFPGPLLHEFGMTFPPSP